MADPFAPRTPSLQRELSPPLSVLRPPPFSRTEPGLAPHQIQAIEQELSNLTFLTVTLPSKFTQAEVLFLVAQWVEWISHDQGLPNPIPNPRVGRQTERRRDSTAPANDLSSHDSSSEGDGARGYNNPPRRRGRRHARATDPAEDTPENLSALADNLHETTIDPAQDITLSFSAQIDIDSLDELRERWGHRLLNERRTILKNRRLVPAGFDMADIRKLGNLFFYTIFGQGGLDYVESLIQDYGSAPGQGPGSASAYLAENQAEDPTVPAVLQHFFASIAAHIRSKERDTLSTHLATLRNGVRMINDYTTLSQACGTRDNQLVHFLARKGYQLGARGVRLTSLLKRYIEESCRMSSSDFNNAMADYRSVYNLLDKFDRGILALISPAAFNSIRQFSSQKFKIALEHFCALCPFFVDWCYILEAQVVDPILMGRVIEESDELVARLNADGPIMTRFADLVEEAEGEADDYEMVD